MTLRQQLRGQLEPQARQAKLRVQLVAALRGEAQDADRTLLTRRSVRINLPRAAAQSKMQDRPSLRMLLSRMLEVVVSWIRIRTIAARFRRCRVHR